jgi:hypothetical protein
VLLSLGQLARTLDSVAKRCAEKAKPVKGKKRPTGLVALLADLKAAREELRDEVDKLDLGHPVDVGSASSGSGWETAVAWTSGEHVAALGDRLDEARSEFEAGIGRLLGSKAL